MIYSSYLNSSSPTVSNISNVYATTCGSDTWMKTYKWIKNRSWYDDCTTTASATEINYYNDLTSTTCLNDSGYNTYCHPFNNNTIIVYKYGVTQFETKTPAEKILEIMRLRQSPVLLTNRMALRPAADIREICARQTLAKVLTQQDFRGFLRNGFVSARARSGRVYQIFPGHDVTKVYLNGECVERLCVVLKGNFPATDSLIMRYLLILNDEEGFRKLAIRHQVIRPNQNVQTVDSRSLPEIYRKLKVA